MDESEDVYSSLMAGESILESIETSDILGKIKLELDKRKSELQARLKTSKLCLNYQKMFRVVRALINPNRTGCKYLSFSMQITH